MARLENVGWSPRRYTLREFLRSCALPKIVKVTQGHYGNADIEQLALDQVIRIHKEHTQRRVVANDKHGRHLSIPLNYQSVLFERVRRETDKRQKKAAAADELPAAFPMTIADVVAQYPLPVLVKIHRSEELRFSVDNRKQVPRFDVIELTDLQDETYLLGNTINNGLLSKSVLVIPMFMKLELAVADGLVGGDDDQWLELVGRYDRTVVRCVDFEQACGNRDILMYPSRLVEARQHVLEDIEPHVLKIHPLSTDKTLWPRPLSDSETQFNTHRVRHRHNPEAKGPASPVLSWPMTVSVRGNQRSRRKEAEDEKSQRRVSADLLSTNDEEAPAADDLMVPEEKTRYRQAPEGGPRQDLAKPRENVTASTGQRERRKTPSQDPQQTSATTRTAALKPRIKEPKQEYEHPPSAPIKPSPALTAKYAGLSEVPEDTTALNVDDLSDCLRLLKLDSFVNVFKEEMIDGKLLMDLDRRMLINDLGMNEFQATKLLRFQRGWRPK
ncbi:GAREM2 [Branchiostoma lanceolatum]|uniref:GAREM2 protein n=1 Tax=Branchiostoma lanceolatum TaxID=7740 RepID=A0A8J9Z233_BRALA|nr:GAREM2 [Branchiostoma lanceolatum]